jgi:UDP-N-acetyl-D-mannosaminuronic acid dehydrogenase
MEGNFLLGKSAIQINEQLPDFVVSKLKNMFELDRMVIGILGMTFKQNIDDFRSSLSFRIKHLVVKHAKGVLCSDEMLQRNYFVSKEELIRRSDLIIVATPHTEYKKINTQKPILDIWRITNLPSII